MCFRIPLAMADRLVRIANYIPREVELGLPHFYESRAEAGRGAGRGLRRAPPRRLEDIKTTEAEDRLVILPDDFGAPLHWFPHEFKWTLWPATGRVLKC